MLDRPVVAFDIETIPDPEMGRRIMGITGDDHAVVVEMVRRRLEETADATKYPPLPMHRVVCACVTILDPEMESVELRAFGRDSMDERGIIAAFFDLLAAMAPSPRLVSWNGRAFDLAVLRYRAMKYGIAAPDFYREGGDRRYASYVNRYHDLHVDVMDVLSSYGASPRAGLGMICGLLELPGKSFLDGEVYEHVFAGELGRVIEYCKLDTLETLLVFLVWSVHTGSLGARDFADHMTQIRRLVARQDGREWRDVADALEAWPPWLAPES